MNGALGTRHHKKFHMNVDQIPEAKEKEVLKRYLENDG
jgi:hypothetical protein